MKVDHDVTRADGSVIGTHLTGYFRNGRKYSHFVSTPSVPACPWERPDGRTCKLPANHMQPCRFADDADHTETRVFRAPQRRIPQRRKHAHPRPVDPAAPPLCGAFVNGTLTADHRYPCVEPEGHLSTLGTPHRSPDGETWAGPDSTYIRWYRDATEAATAQAVWSANTDAPHPGTAPSAPWTPGSMRNTTAAMWR